MPEREGLSCSSNACRCAETAVHIARNLQEAQRLSRFAVTMGRAALHGDWAKQKLPELTKCLGVDFTETASLIAKAEKSRRVEEASGLYRDAMASFLRGLRKCQT